MSTADTALQGDLSTPQDLDRRFFFKMSLACLAVALIGFAPTYWRPVVTGASQEAFIVHLHATLFFGWTGFLVLQSYWVASGRILRHRDWGLAGIALASTMVCVGVLMTIHSLRVNIALGVPDAIRPFSIVSFSAIMFFAVLFAIAIANVRNADLHKRLILIATISMLQAAVARWFRIFLAPPDAIGPPPVAASIPAGLVVDLLVIAGMIYDKRTRGKVHPAYWIAGAAMLAVQVLRVPLSQTEAWLAFADWLAKTG